MNIRIVAVVLTKKNTKQNKMCTEYLPLLLYTVESCSLNIGVSKLKWI